MIFQEFHHSLKREINELGRNRTPSELYEPMFYLLKNDDQRLSAQMICLSNYLFSDDLEKVIKPAAGVELFSQFISMSDDLINEVPSRDGLPAVHKKWNKNAVILSGDTMLINSCKLLSEGQYPLAARLTEAFIRCSEKVLGGRSLRLKYRYPYRMTEREYLDFLKNNIACFFGFCAELGGMLGETRKDNLLHLRRFGENLGVALQLKRELQLVFGDHQAEGHVIISNNTNYPLVKALEIAKGAQLKQLQDLLSSPAYSREEKLKGISAIYRDCALKEMTENKILEFFASALSALNEVDADKVRKELLMQYAAGVLQINAAGPMKNYH